MNKTICKKSIRYVRDFEPCFIKGKEYFYKIEDSPIYIGNYPITNKSVKHFKLYSLEKPSEVRGIFYESLFKEHFYTSSEIRKMKLKKLKI